MLTPAPLWIEVTEPKALVQHVFFNSLLTYVIWIFFQKNIYVIRGENHL